MCAERGGGARRRAHLLTARRTSARHAYGLEGRADRVGGVVALELGLGTQEQAVAQDRDREPRDDDREQDEKRSLHRVAHASLADPLDPAVIAV